MIAGLILAAAVATASTPAMNVWFLEANAARSYVTFEVEQRRGEDGDESNLDESETIAMPAIVATLPGLTLDQLNSDGTAVRFHLKRDAGTLACEGWAKRGNASGSFTIALDAGYARELERRGMGSTTFEQQERLVLEDGSLALLDAFAKYGYERFSVAQFVQLVEHGVSLTYVNAMNAAGFRPHTVEEIVRARDHGVSTDYVQALRAAGITGSLDDYIRGRDHGVSADQIRGLAGLGYHGLSLEQLVRLRDHGVSVDFIQRLRAQGYTNLSIDDLVRLRDHGV